MSEQHQPRNLTDTNGELLSCVAAANYLGLHPNTLSNWARAGTIDCFRVGRRRDYRFTRAALDKAAPIVQAITGSGASRTIPATGAKYEEE